MRVRVNGKLFQQQFLIGTGQRKSNREPRNDRNTSFFSLLVFLENYKNDLVPK